MLVLSLYYSVQTPSFLRAMPPRGRFAMSLTESSISTISSRDMIAARSSDSSPSSKNCHIPSSKSWKTVVTGCSPFKISFVVITMVFLTSLNKYLIQLYFLLSGFLVLIELVRSIIIQSSFLVKFLRSGSASKRNGCKNTFFRVRFKSYRDFVQIL